MRPAWSDARTAHLVSCTIWIDVSSPTALIWVPISQGRGSIAPIPVPRDPTLIGLSMAAQAVCTPQSNGVPVTGFGNFAFSNGLLMTIGF